MGVECVRTWIPHTQKIIFSQNVSYGLRFDGFFEMHRQKMKAYRIFVAKPEGK
jgi:hypothetical protein